MTSGHCAPALIFLRASFPEQPGISSLAIGTLTVLSRLGSTVPSRSQSIPIPVLDVLAVPSSPPNTAVNVKGPEPLTPGCIISFIPSASTSARESSVAAFTRE